MAISVNVPKDWSGIKRKVIFNLTQRQLVSFALGGIVGIPFYSFTKDILGPDISALGMVAVMLPFFFLAMYEKDGFPAEKIQRRHCETGKQPDSRKHRSKRRRTKDFCTGSAGAWNLSEL